MAKASTPSEGCDEARAGGNVLAFPLTPRPFEQGIAILADLPGGVVALHKPSPMPERQPSPWRPEALILVALLATLPEETREQIDYHAAWLAGPEVDCASVGEMVRVLINGADGVADLRKPSKRALKLHRKDRRKAARAAAV